MILLEPLSTIVFLKTIVEAKPQDQTVFKYIKPILIFKYLDLQSYNLNTKKKVFTLKFLVHMTITKHTQKMIFKM